MTRHTAARDAPAAPDAPTTRDAIAARFERLPASRWHVVVRLVVGVVTFFEAFDQLLIAYALPELRQEWHLTTGEATSVLTVGSVGMLIGALLSGRLADRYGRVKVIAYCVAASGLAGLALVACTSLTPSWPCASSRGSRSAAKCRWPRRSSARSPGASSGAASSCCTNSSSPRD